MRNWSCVSALGLIGRFQQKHKEPLLANRFTLIQRRPADFRKWHIATFLPCGIGRYRGIADIDQSH
jgi:hypothetical protein